MLCIVILTHPASNTEGLDPVPHVHGLIATGEVVYRLLSKLPSSKYRIICLDNFYDASDPSHGPEGVQTAGRLGTYFSEDRKQNPPHAV